MMVSGHALSGTAVGLATAPAMVDGIGSGLVWVALCTISASFPDIDHQNSTITKLLGPFFGLPFRILRKLSPHRTMTHSMLGAALWWLLLEWLCRSASLPGWISTAFVIGVVTHIAGDMITRDSVWLTWPFGRKPKRSSLRIKAGGSIEKIVIYPLLMICCGALTLQLLI